MPSLTTSVQPGQIVATLSLQSAVVVAVCSPESLQSRSALTTVSFPLSTKLSLSKSS